MDILYFAESVFSRLFKRGFTSVKNGPYAGCSQWVHFLWFDSFLPDFAGAFAGNTKFGTVFIDRPAGYGNAHCVELVAKGLVAQGMVLIFVINEGLQGKFQGFIRCFRSFFLRGFGSRPDKEGICWVSAPTAGDDLMGEGAADCGNGKTCIIRKIRQF